jgi:hypothetical protein
LVSELRMYGLRIRRQCRSPERLCLGEVGLKVLVGRAPALAKGEINRTPAGVAELSVAVEAPGGRLDAVALPIVAKVITIRPCAR